ncbi:HDOD domain-containing protein [Propionivibrio limicola]|uniref:HDOD domain-containing protein n=1 Tax=Propionivibrio limicola TaxID=167645 RepID=UPI0012919AA6|nr:HDOD domain-containing protein [Propionivibrio limicola]
MRLVDPDRYSALKATGKLPSPKGVALSIIRLLQADDFRIADLVHLVQSDPAIAGRVLYFANAAAFGRSRPIISLHRAIVALGSFRVRDLVIGLSVMQGYRYGLCSAFDYEGFWGHSLATGIACQELADTAGIASEEIFTIGLLARVGELALASLFPDEYAEVLRVAREGGRDLVELELQRFSMEHRELGASLLCEWGLPEMLAQAAFHHENPDAAGFADGSRVQTLTHALSFASALGHLCMVDEEGRWSLLPGLLARAARLGISGDTLNELVDRMVGRWCEWGAKLQIRTQSLPPFAEILAATPPLRRMSITGLASLTAETPRSVGKKEADKAPTNGGTDRRANGFPHLRVLLIGIPLPELPALMQQIETLGHQPVLVDEAEAYPLADSHPPAEIIIADLSAPRLRAAEFCRRVRQTPHGKDCYLLFLLPPNGEKRATEAIKAGADDVLTKPINDQALRAHINLAARMRAMREEIHRERQGIMRSTDEFAIAQKRLLQDALTDPLTQLPNRRKGLDFLASELIYSRTTGMPLTCLMIDIDHFKDINDTHGHAAGDAILRHLAGILKRSTRSEDMVFRYGGEEFVAILTRAPKHNAEQIAERMRMHIEKAVFRWNKQRIPVTISIGLATAGRGVDSTALIETADTALYKAKKEGRNCVVCSPGDV